MSSWHARTWRALMIPHGAFKRLFRSRPRPERCPLIFGIGMHRTGTRSLDEYLRQLGLKTIHWPWMYEPVMRRLPHLGEQAVVQVLWPLFSVYDCFTDVPFPALYRELDRLFPKARFILTTRDTASWWRSVVGLWQLNTRKSWPLIPGEIIQYGLDLKRYTMSVSLEDEELLTNRYEKHNTEVVEYFKGREGKLLTLDLHDSRKSKLVSGFLGLPVRDYPHMK